MNQEPNVKNMPILTITSIKAYALLVANMLLGAISFFGVSLDDVARILSVIATFILLPYTIKKLKQDYELKEEHKKLVLVQKQKEAILLQQEEQRLADLLLQSKRANGVYDDQTN